MFRNQNDEWPDVLDKCEKLCLEYDAIISKTVESNKSLSIDIILEHPALMAVELFHADGTIDEETRR